MQLGNVLNLLRGIDGEVLNAFETDRLVDFCVDLAVRSIGVAFDFEIARGECGDGTSDGARRIGNEILVDRGSRCVADGVLRDRAGDLRGIVILEQEQSSGGREIVVGIEDAESNGVRLAVAEESGERRKVNTIGNKVECLNGGNRFPKERIHATSITVLRTRDRTW